MNKVILMGRLTRDPDVRYSQGETPLAVARYSLAVDRRGRSNSQDGATADFINCVAFGRQGEFAEKYLYNQLHCLFHRIHKLFFFYGFRLFSSLENQLFLSY